MAKCIMELERIYGIQKGNNQYDSLQDNLTSTQSGLAEQIGVSRQQLQDYKKLNDLIPELQQMVENGSMKCATEFKDSNTYSNLGKSKIFALLNILPSWGKHIEAILFLFFRKQDHILAFTNLGTLSKHLDNLYRVNKGQI